SGSVEDESIREPAPPEIVHKISGGPHVFISYRRDDGAFYADFLVAALMAEVPDVHIFRDEDTLKPGMVYPKKIDQTISECDIVLAVIGKKWTGSKADGTRRIDLASDWVRLEVAAALRHNKWVIPRLTGGARMPAKDKLPEDIGEIADRQAIVLTQKEP